MELHVLGYPEHDLIFSEKCLSVCVRHKSFVTSVAQELVGGIS